MAHHRIVPNLLPGALTPHGEGVPGGLATDPLRFVLPRQDAVYQEALQLRSLQPGAYASLDGLFASFGICIAFLMLRLVFNSSLAALGPVRALRRSKDGQRNMDKVEEEVWVTVGGVVLLMAGWQCVLSVSGYCSLSNAAGCLDNWPLIPIEPRVHSYYNLELGWYLHLMLKHALGLGLQDNTTMGAHHIATVALITLSYMLNVHLPGLLVFAVLNASSPLLHLSKLASALELRRTKTALFAAFAAVFFVTRVVVFPYVIGRIAMYQTLVSVRGLVQYFLPFWLVCNVLLLVLCVMQWVWFSAVLRILKAALSGSSSQLQHEMARDPAGQGAKLIPGCEPVAAASGSCGCSCSCGAGSS